MKREEAIELKAAVGRLMYSNNKDVRDYNALIDFIESALRPVSREQVEKVWRGEWIYEGMAGDFAWINDGRGYCWKIFECSKCQCKTNDQTLFCPNCGAKMEWEEVDL